MGKCGTAQNNVHHGVIFLQFQFSRFHGRSENEVATNEVSPFFPDKIYSGVEINIKNCGT